MLRHRADRRSVLYMLVTTALLGVQWSLPEWNPFLWAWALFMAVSVAVMSHNHNHCPMWKSRFMNGLTDHWLTLFYGFPVFGWIPTHNANHHKYVNREGDFTVTWRFTEKDNLLTLLTYPSISSWYQQKVIGKYLRRLWRTNRPRFWHSVSQYAVLGAFIAGALFLDWRKALLYVIIPQQVSLFTVLVFNYLQHVGTDEESKWNHSRNIVGPWMNRLLFNNGFHTIHHEQPGMHWSKTPQGHAGIAAHIEPMLNERSFWWLIARTYLLAPFVPRFRPRSLRVERIEAERARERRESGIAGPSVDTSAAA